MNKNTIVVDYDGVIHKYSKGWSDGSIYDPPVEGVKEALQDLLNSGYEVVIFSTRTHSKEVNGAYESGQVAEMADWLAEYEIPYTRIYIGVGKPLCKIFIDDNALRFEGDWSKTVSDVKKLVPQE